jgi:hypothetical protein
MKRVMSLAGASLGGECVSAGTNFERFYAAAPSVVGCRCCEREPLPVPRQPFAAAAGGVCAGAAPQPGSASMQLASAPVQTYGKSARRLALSIPNAPSCVAVPTFGAVSALIRPGYIASGWLAQS